MIIFIVKHNSLINFSVITLCKDWCCNMKNNKNFSKLTVLIIVCALLGVVIVIPLLLKCPFIQSIVSWWLSFTEEPSYKNTYIQFWGNVISVFISIFGALRIENYLRNKSDQSAKEKCLRNLHGELKRCFYTLQNIYKDTFKTIQTNQVGQENLDTFCEIAKLHKLNLNQEWVLWLAQLNGLITPYDWYVLQKFFCRLSVIDQAISSENNDTIQKVYVSYICWFITNDGKRIHSDIESFMNKLENMFK